MLDRVYGACINRKRHAVKEDLGLRYKSIY